MRPAAGRRKRADEVAEIVGRRDPAGIGRRQSRVPPSCRAGSACRRSGRCPWRRPWRSCRRQARRSRVEARLFIAAHNRVRRSPKQSALCWASATRHVRASTSAMRHQSRQPTARRSLVARAPRRQPERHIAKFALRHGVEHRMRQRVGHPSERHRRQARLCRACRRRRRSSAMIKSSPSSPPRSDCLSLKSAVSAVFQLRFRPRRFRKTEMAMLNRVHLNGLRAVETVARLGSLAAAAGELNVSVSAVSQQINRTEKQLGQALFERTASGLVLTEFGAVFAARLGAGFPRACRRRWRWPTRRANARWWFRWRRPSPRNGCCRGCRGISTGIPTCCCASTLRCGWPISTTPTSTSPSGWATANGRAGARNCCLAQEVFPVCAPAIAQETEVDRGPGADLRHHRRAGDDQLGELVRGRRRRAGHLPARARVSPTRCCAWNRRSPAMA